jgi:hypothetical protein
MLDTFGETMETDRLIQVIASFGRTFLSEVIKLGAYASSDGGLSVILFILAVLTIFYGNAIPTPTSTPAPIPF